MFAKCKVCSTTDRSQQVQSTKLRWHKSHNRWIHIQSHQWVCVISFLNLCSVAGQLLLSSPKQVQCVAGIGNYNPMESMPMYATCLV